MNNGIVRVAGVGENASNVASQSVGGVSSFLTSIWEGVPYFVAALLVVALAYFIAKKAQWYAEDMVLKTSAHAEGALGLIGKSAFFAVFGTGVVTALNILNIDLTLIMSAVGFGVGFAIKDILFNYLAGLFMIMTSPFKIGDLVQIDTHIGRVREIAARNCVIRTNDGHKLIISNADIFSARIINYTAFPERRLDQVIGVGYDEDLQFVMRLLKSVLEKSPSILRSPAPQVFVSEFGDSTINFTLRYWIDSSMNWKEAQSIIFLSVKKAFDTAGIVVPYNTLTLTTPPTDMFHVHQVNDAEYQTLQKQKVAIQPLVADEFDSGDWENVGRMKTLDEMTEKAREGKTKRVIDEYNRLEGETAVHSAAVSPLVAHEPVNPPEPVMAESVMDKQPSEVSLEEMIQEQKKKFASVDDALAAEQVFVPQDEKPEKEASPEDDMETVSSQKPQTTKKRNTNDFDENPIVSS